MYGADDNPEEANYVDIRLPGNMAWGGGNQGGGRGQTPSPISLA